MYICSYVTDCKLVKIKMYDLCIYLWYLFIKHWQQTKIFRYSQKVFSTTAFKSHSHTFKLCIRNGLKTRKKQCVMMWKRAALQVGD